MDLEQKLHELKRRDRLAKEGGGKERLERQHKEGKMSARERIEFLLDDGTFEETDRFVTHHGPVRWRRGLFSSHHRLYSDGQQHFVHVYYWTGRHQDGHARGGHQGAAWRRGYSQ